MVLACNTLVTSIHVVHKWHKRDNVVLSWLVYRSGSEQNLYIVCVFIFVCAYVCCIDMIFFVAAMSKLLTLITVLLSTVNILWQPPLWTCVPYHKRTELNTIHAEVCLPYHKSTEQKRQPFVSALERNMSSQS